MYIKRTNKQQELANRTHKRCAQCGEIKELDCFRDIKGKKEGIRYKVSYCKPCQNKRTSRRRDAKVKVDSKLRLRRNLRTLIIQVIKRQGYTKQSRTQAMLGCSFNELTLHIGECPGKDYQLDHICPCAQAQSLGELEKLQHYTNLRWLHKLENNLKNSHKTEEGVALCRSLLNREWID